MQTGEETHSAPPDGVVINPETDGPMEPVGSTAPEASEASVDAVDHLLYEVEHALSRLDDGTYGQCSSCGEPIGDTRLSDDPTASECASCVSRDDG